MIMIKMKEEYRIHVHIPTIIRVCLHRFYLDLLLHYFSCKGFASTKKEAETGRWSEGCKGEGIIVVKDSRGSIDNNWIEFELEEEFGLF